MHADGVPPLVYTRHGAPDDDHQLLNNTQQRLAQRRQEGGAQGLLLRLRPTTTSTTTTSCRCIPRPRSQDDPELQAGAHIGLQLVCAALAGGLQGPGQHV